MTEKISYILNGFLYAGALTQTREAFQIAQLVISILITLFLFFINIRKWYKEANKDGKITKEEIEEGKEIVKDTMEDIKEIIKK